MSAGLTPVACSWGKVRGVVDMFQTYGPGLGEPGGCASLRAATHKNFDYDAEDPLILGAPQNGGGPE